MQLQLRKRYETRSTRTTNLKPIEPDFPTSGARTRQQQRHLRTSYEVYYSDEEHPELEQSGQTSKEEAKIQDDLKSSKEPEAEEQQDDSGSKFNELGKNGKNHIIRKRRKQKNKKDPPTVKQHADNQNSKKSFGSMNEQNREDDLSKQERDVNNASHGVLQLKGDPEKMVDEKQDRQQSSKKQEEKDPKNKDKIEQKLNALARMNFNPDSKMKNPFCVLEQYRSQFQKQTKQDYRQFLKKRDQKSPDYFSDKKTFGLTREKIANQALSSVKNEDSAEAFNHQNQVLFQQCKMMPKQQQLDFLLKHFHEVLTAEIQKQKQQFIEKQRKQQRSKIGFSSGIIDQVIKVPCHNEVSITGCNRDKMMGKKKQIAMDQQIKIEQNMMPLMNTQTNSKTLLSKMPLLTQIHSRNHDKVRQQQSKKNKFESTKSKSQSEPSQKQKKEPKDIMDYKRDEILRKIAQVNQKCNKEQKASLIEEQKREKQSFINSVLSVGSQPSKEHQNQIPKHSFQLDSGTGFGEIEIRTQQPSEKTDQQTRPENVSYEEKDLYRDNEGTSWSSFSRVGPKVKRLQILNRYHYNPFEETNGEDQCELWKKLMSDEVEDLKSHYKYQDGEDFDCLFNEFDRLDKGSNLLLKVKQEDFFVKNYYDPVKKQLVEEVSLDFMVSQKCKKEEESEHVTEIDRYLFPHKADIFREEERQEQELDIRKEWEKTQAQRKAIFEAHRLEEERLALENEKSEAKNLAEIKEESAIFQESGDNQKSFGYSQLSDLDLEMMKNHNGSSDNPELNLKEITSKEQEKQEKDVFDML